MTKKSHLGAYGIIIQDNKILLIKKSRGPYQGKYDLPGGSIEFGESIEEALVREIREETNLEVKSYAFYSTESITLEYQNSRGEYIQFHHLGIIYTVIIKNERISLKIDADAHDSLGSIWINMKDCDVDDFSPFAASVLQNYTMNAIN